MDKEPAQPRLDAEDYYLFDDNGQVKEHRPRGRLPNRWPFMVEGMLEHTGGRWYTGRGAASRGLGVLK